MDKITVEIAVQEEWRISINLTPNTLRGDAIQLLNSERVENESLIQITVPVTSMQSVLVTRTVVPVQETDKQTSAEMVLPKVS